MSRITVPKTIKEVTAKLNGLAEIARATEWERAADVYAYTYDAPRGRQAANVRAQALTVSEFAKLGIVGLKTRETVASYRNNYKLAMAAGLAVDVHPGDRVELPDMEWPGRGAEATEGTIRSAKSAAKDYDIANTIVRNIAAMHPELIHEVAGESPEEGWDTVTPAKVVDIVRNNPDVVRAISRHADVVGLIEDQVSERVGSQLSDSERKFKETDRRLTKNLSKALGIEEDQATHCLRMAANFIMNAVVACEEYGIEFPEAEQEAIKRIKRNLKVYESQAPLNDADRAWAAENGIEVPQE